MRKHTKYLFIVFSLAIFLFFKTSFALAVPTATPTQPPSELIVTPKTVNLNDPVRVTINNLSVTTVIHSLVIMKGGGTIADIVASIEINTTGSGCILLSSSGNPWKSTACTGSGPFQFSGELDTGKIQANPNATQNLIYIVRLYKNGAVRTLAAPDESFTINAPQPTVAAPFSITSISPQPAKPGDTITISLNGTSRGVYSGAVEGQSEQQGNCDAVACDLKLTLPVFINTPKVTIVVKDSSGHEVRSELSVIPTGSTPTPSPTLIPLPPPCTDRDPSGRCTGIKTGLGIVIKTNPAEFVKSVFSIVLSISGGIALFLIIYSGYRLIASKGNPETIQGARETLTSAIVGLLFIIFSMVLLEVIGVDILHIPGLN